MFPGMKRDTGKPSELRETFRISITEGVFSQVYTGLAGPGSVFLTKLLTLLQASPVQFGILSAIGQLSMVLQPLGALVTRRMTHHRRSTVLWAAAGRAMTPLLGVIPLVFAPVSALTTVLLVFGLSTAVLSVSTNIWTGWIARMVPLRIRGRFFAKRNSILVSFGLAVAFLVGMIVDGTGDDPDKLRTVLLLVFSGAGIVGLAGLRILAKQPERPVPVNPLPASRILVEPFKDRNFRKLCLFGVWWMMAVGIGAPFWQPFMIQVLHMGITQMLLYGITSTIGTILTLKYWGKLVDRFGNKTAMKLAIIIGTMVPLIWLFVKPESLWIIYAESLVSGSMWGCVGIVTANLVLSVAPEDRVQSYSGLYGAFSGTGMIITMLASGFLMPKPMVLLGLHLHSMQVLFLITAFARLSALIPLSRVEEPNSKPLTAVLGTLRLYSKVKLLNLRVVLNRPGQKK